MRKKTDSLFFLVRPWRVYISEDGDSSVTGTGCLMKQNFFLCACQLAYEGNDFGLCSNTLAIVDSD